MTKNEKIAAVVGTRAAAEFAAFRKVAAMLPTVAQLSRQRRTYIETEVQGPGRRFWFKTAAACRAFDKRKQAAGYATVRDKGSRTMWASFSKRRTPLVDMVVRGGIDPYSLTRSSR